jgi:nucleoside-diphosphate-sugar epimerase
VIDAVVTGAGGFIGRALVQRLRHVEGQTVAELQREDGDVTEAATWDRLPPAAVVYHLAGRSFVPDSWRDAAGFLTTNVVGTERALAYCQRHGAALVLASAYVYGVPERLPIREDDVARPNNPYALSKLMAEQAAEFATRYRGVRSSVLRLFNVFGPGQREEFLIPSILRQVGHETSIRVMSATPRRDYVFLDDVVDAFVRAAPAAHGFSRFNIGSGVSLSVADVCKVIQDVAGTSWPLRCEGIDRPEEIPDTRASIDHAREVLGWQPHFSFNEGIRRMVDRSNS